MRHAVIFSSYVPDTAVAQAVGRYYIDLFQRNFSDCTIYVGLNTGSSPDWRVRLSCSGLDVVFCEVLDRLSVNSDVAGFQAVLRTLRSTRAKHDFYWFGHTKGATHDSYEGAELLRWVLERDFWSRRKEIEDQCDPTRYGSFPALPMPAAGPNREVVQYLRSIFPTCYAPVGYVSTNTFFGMTGICLRNFLAGANEQFFDQRLTDMIGVSRYFFEGGFSWIADMAGFEPYLLQKLYRHLPDDPALDEPGYDDQFEISQQRVVRMVKEWRANRQGYDFQGWPIWVGDRIQFGCDLHEREDFFSLYPKHRPRQP